jgi:hypothetical protein
MTNEKQQDFIELNGEKFELIDEINNIPIVDSFVKKNKVGRGSGEARLYIGSQRGNQDFALFFNNFPAKALFLKKDFEDYLNDAKFEYEQQEQVYLRDISGDWQEYYSTLQTFSDRIFFNVEKAVGSRDLARYYIRSFDYVFREYFRSVMLPVISYVSILKLKDASGSFFFLFRPALSYSFNPYYHPAKLTEVTKSINAKDISPKRKRYLVDSRDGQGEYRKNLLNESSECIITRVNDERVLIASHIKPWSVADDREKVDYNNGLVLTPTYDRLFDQGFLSFLDDGTILLSPYISPLNLKKLNLTKGKKYIIPESLKRRAYLEYHRMHIFKK